MTTTINGRPITDAIAIRITKILSKIKSGFGVDLQEIQNTTKKVAIGTYDFTTDAVNVNFTNASVSVTDNTITTTTVHGLKTGDTVVLTTAGTLPTGLSTATAYYVIKTSSTVFKLATSRANAFAGTAIDITGTTGATTVAHVAHKGIFGAINLLAQGTVIPDGAVITRTFYQVLTTFESTTTDNATIALSLNAANDITTATAIKTEGDIWDAAGFVAGSQANTPATFLKLTDDRELLMTVGSDTLTAGKLKVFVEYIDVEA